jgi:hypothetical protein
MQVLNMLSDGLATGAQRHDRRVIKPSMFAHVLH